MGRVATRKHCSIAPVGCVAPLILQGAAAKKMWGEGAAGREFFRKFAVGK